MAWNKPWRVVKSLDRLNAQIRAACPRAVPPATPASSWGSLADSAHSTTSDHYPHYYGALGSTAVVCARDFPHAPNLGLDIHAILDRLRLSKDPRIGYLISNRRITGPNYGWQWSRYNGSNPHTTHGHVSSVRTKLADDTRDWAIGTKPPEDTVAGYGFRTQRQADDLIYTVTAIPDPAGGSKRVPLHVALARMDAELDAIAKKLGVNLTAIRQGFDQLLEDEQAEQAAAPAAEESEAVAEPDG